MITQQQLRELAAANNGNMPITSLYLEVEGGRNPTKGTKILLKALLKTQRQALEDQDLSKSALESVENDLVRCERYVEEELYTSRRKGLALFSTSHQSYWRVYDLPQPLGNILRVDQKAYIRPLSELFDAWPPYCMVMVSRDKARIVEVSSGEIRAQKQVLGEVPGQVREGGWSGYSEKRIGRHIEDHMRRHLKQVAEEVFELFKKNDFGALILSGHSELLQEFEKLLHSTLLDRVSGRLHLEPQVVLERALKESQQILAQAKAERDQALSEELFNRARGNDTAVTGLRNTLLALQQSRLHTLIVNRSFFSSGVSCSQCGYVGADERKCPLCGSETRVIPDAVNRALVWAVTHNLPVIHITDQGQQRVNIGGLLKFKM